VTCIVAGDGWMAADRRVTEDDGSSSSLIKIAKNPWLIAAAAGNASSTLDVRRAVRAGAQIVEDLIEHVDKDSVALVMNKDGQLFKIQEKRVWSARPLVAIGSGGDLVIGWLSSQDIDDWPWAFEEGDDMTLNKRQAIRLAFRFVASRRADCGGGVDIRRTYAKERSRSSVDTES
jgi:hypothetical protein